MVRQWTFGTWKFFLNVARHLNFTRAGEEVNLAQPGVSVHIRQLENEVGLKLLGRAAQTFIAMAEKMK